MNAARMCRYGLAALLIWAPACAPVPPPPKESDVTAIVDKFYGAVKAGDKKAVMQLIAPDAVFVESGKIETRAEYEDLELIHEGSLGGQRSAISVLTADCCFTARPKSPHRRR